MERSAGFALEAAVVHYRHAVLSKARLEEQPAGEMLDETMIDGIEKIALAMKQGKSVHEGDAASLIERLEWKLSELSGSS
jgi:hypothetical protein